MPDYREYTIKMEGTTLIIREDEMISIFHYDYTNVTKSYSETERASMLRRAKARVK